MTATEDARKSAPAAGDDYGYIIKIIQLLEYDFGVRFFITSRDFDILYRWWEKRIPMSVVSESIANVVARRRKRGQDISTFANFSYEVRKNFRSFMELHVGAPIEEVERETAHTEIERFMKNIPRELSVLKGEFQVLADGVKRGESVSVDSLHRSLLRLFQNDAELNLRTEMFLKDLAKEIRRPDIERKYRINYLCHRYRIPDFDQ